MAGTTLRASSVVNSLKLMKSEEYPPKRLSVLSFRNRELTKDSEVLLMKKILVTKQ